MVFEGLYVSLGFNSGEFLLEQVEEILLNSLNVSKADYLADQSIGQRRDCGYIHGYDCECEAGECGLYWVSRAEYHF